MPTRLRTEIEIQATPERVRDVLTRAEPPLAADLKARKETPVRTYRVPPMTAPFPARLGSGLLALLLGAVLAAVLIAPVGGGRQALGFALAPDLALFVGIAPRLERGQLHPRAVPLYNALHHVAGPLLLGIAALLGLGWPWLAGALAWGLHIAVDRAVGYGPRTADGFRRA